MVAQTYEHTPSHLQRTWSTSMSCSRGGCRGWQCSALAGIKHLAHGLKIVIPEVYLSAAVIIALMYVIKTL